MRVLRWVPPMWSLCLSVVIAGPALGPGFVLTYDMVMVPNPSFVPSTWGLGTGLPRAVPSDALLTAAAQVLPAQLVQKVLLVGLLIGAGWGASTMLASRPMPVRLVASTVYLWNPFVAERLVIGHWPLLVGYATLPWIVRVATRLTSMTDVARLILLLALAAMTPTGGILAALTAVTVLISTRQTRHRTMVLTMAAGLVVNSPWWVAGAVHGVAARSDPDAVAAFASRGEIPGGVLASLLGLGGIWNAEVVPATRSTWLAPAGVTVLLVLIGCGLPSLLRERYGASLLALGAVGLMLALLGSSPGTRGVLEWLVTTVPGAGLLRDGQKWIALLAPLVAAASALGAERLAKWVRDPQAVNVILVGSCLLVVALMPDLAWGAGNRLHAVSYPPEWATARASISSSKAPGDVLVLPFTPFRRFSWNGGRTALDPAGRFFPRETVVSDRLSVGPVRLSGEDPRAAAAGRALALSRLDATALSGLGIRWVVVEREVPGSTPIPRGVRLVLERPRLAVLRVPGLVARQPRLGAGPVFAADLAAGAIVGLATVVVIPWRGRVGRRPARRNA